MWKNTASPGSSSQPMTLNCSGSASMSGSSVSEPSGNQRAWPSRNDRGMYHGPRWEPATNSSVDALGTLSTGNHMLAFRRPSTL
jgi:hypothetical protein